MSEIEQSSVSQDNQSMERLMKIIREEVIPRYNSLSEVSSEENESTEELDDLTRIILSHAIFGGF